MPASARGGRPGQSRRSWGWHPLVDEWAARVVADADIRPGELVYDLGAGDGALTGPLLAAGARVIAMELHPGRVRLLRERHPEATVVQADLLDLRPPRRPYRVVASPPYGISSALVRLLLAPGSGLVAADLVLQRATVRRLREAAAGSRSWQLRDGMPLPRRAFRPPPQVDSAVLVVRRR